MRVQQIMCYMAQRFPHKVIVQCLNFRVVMRITQFIGCVFRIVGVDTSLAYPVLRRNRSTRLTTAGNTSARTCHNFHEMKIAGTVFYFFAQLARIV